MAICFDSNYKDNYINEYYICYDPECNYVDVDVDLDIDYTDKSEVIKVKV
jgi:hypothetical protein